MTIPQPSPSATVHGRVLHSSRCQAAAGFYQLSFQAMNTHCRVNFLSQAPSAALRFQKEVLRWVAWFEAQYSRFIPDSLIGRINAAAGLHWVEVDPETDALFNLCQEMVFFTRGVFDPTALPLLRLWNWKANPPVVPQASAVAWKSCSSSESAVNAGGGVSMESRAAMSEAYSKEKFLAKAQRRKEKLGWGGGFFLFPPRY